LGKFLIIAGISLLFLGFIIYLFEDHLSWFGNLPLDFSFKSKSTQIYAPFGSMIILSIIVSIIINFFLKFLDK